MPISRTTLSNQVSMLKYIYNELKEWENLTIHDIQHHRSPAQARYAVYTTPTNRTSDLYITCGTYSTYFIEQIRGKILIGYHPDIWTNELIHVPFPRTIDYCNLIIFTFKKLQQLTEKDFPVNKITSYTKLSTYINTNIPLDKIRIGGS